MTTLTTETPAPAPPPLSLRPISSRRKATDRAARVFIYLAFLLALIPLVWVLFTVISKGIALVLTSANADATIEGDYLQVAEDLGCTEELGAIAEIIKSGSSSDRQRRVAEQHDGALVPVVDSLIAELKA